MRRFLKRQSVAVGLAVGLLVSCSGTAAEAWRGGGALAAWGTASPIAAGSTSLDLFLGLGELEISSHTEMSLFPYTVGDQAFSLGVVHEWLSLSAQYEFSLLPIGITSATLLARAAPDAWETSCGDSLVFLSAQGEGRLAGSAFGSAPLRGELWLRGAAGISRDVGLIDQLLAEASLEATLTSTDKGRIWPVPGLLVMASLGWASLASETSLALAPDVHVASETLSLRGSWSALGLSAGLSLELSDEESPTLSLEASYEFGDAPGRPFPSTPECEGGVCR